MKVHQTLHGYAEGHSLLAHTLPLEPLERKRLDQLSDLSGYLHRGSEFTAYHTGYPCGRFYAIGRTWLDHQAERRGSVFTHTLLLSLEDTASLDDLGALFALFSRPTRPLALEPYRRPLQLSEATGRHQVSPAVAEAAVSAWFAQPLRPVLWEDRETAEEAVRWLWPRLPSAQRIRWSFCTYALNPRYLADAPLDWLAPASVAGMAFYTLRDRAFTARLGERSDAPTSAWLSFLATSEAREIQQTWAAAERVGLTLDTAARIRLWLHRSSLKDAMDLRSTLAVLDADEALGLTGEVTEPDVDRALAALAGPLPPGRLLLSVHEVIARTPHRHAPSRTDRTASTIGRTLIEGLPGLHLDEVPRLQRLLQASREAGLEEPVEAGVVEGIADAPADLAGAILRALFPGEPVLWRQAISRLPPETQSAVVRGWLEASADEALIIEAIASLDIDLASHLAAQDSRLAVRLIPRWLEDTTVRSVEEWRVIFQPMKTATLLSLAASTAIDKSEPAQLALSELVSDAVDLFSSPPGEEPLWLLKRVFLQRASARDAQLRDHPVETIALAAALQIEHYMLHELIRASEPEALCAALAPDTLPPYYWASSAARHVLPAAVRRFLDDALAPAEMNSWFIVADQVHSTEIRPMLVTAQGSALQQAATLLSLPGARFLRSAFDIEDIFATWLTLERDVLQPLTPSWIALLQLLQREQRKLSQELAARLLAHVLNDKDPGWHLLAEETFTPVHDLLCKKERSYGFIRWIREFWGKDWDRAKHIRRTLAHVWVQRAWPSLSLWRVCREDRDLFLKLLKQVKKEPGGFTALRKLEQEPELPSWARKRLFD